MQITQVRELQERNFKSFGLRFASIESLADVADLLAEKYSALSDSELTPFGPSKIIIPGTMVYKKSYELLDETTPVIVISGNNMCHDGFIDYSVYQVHDKADKFEAFHNALEDELWWKFVYQF